LRSADFLDVARHPTITFRSKRITPAGPGAFKVTGDLTLHGVTRAVVLDVAPSANPVADQAASGRLRGSATSRLNREDFGIGGGFLVGEDVDVTIDVEVVRK
jgi:polyisoprenoid-binding protein YceI